MVDEAGQAGDCTLPPALCRAARFVRARDHTLEDLPCCVAHTLHALYLFLALLALLALLAYLAPDV